MGNIYKVSIACVFTAFGAHAWGACESGSAGERIACLQMNFCPNPASTQERTACFQMITAALQDETAKSALPPTEIASQPAEASVPVPAAEIASRPPKTSLPSAEAASQPVVAAPLPDAALERDPQRESSLVEAGAEPEAKGAAKKEKGVIRRFFGVFNVERDKEVVEPGWKSIVYVRREARGSELLVLDDGEVWLETVRNPYIKLTINDWVKITESSTLIRRSGGSTQVEKLDCSVRPLRGSCRGLSDYL